MTQPERIHDAPLPTPLFGEWAELALACIGGTILVGLLIWAGVV